MAEAQADTIVFVCECGPILGDLLDLDALEKFAGTVPGVGAVERFSTLCSLDGREFVTAKLQEHPGMRPVFAACTPREHGETLGAACEAAGVNRYLAGRANIREQCAWVTSDKAEATEKAKDLVAAAVARTELQEPLVAPEIACETSVLVIGAGIAGMTAALLLADAGRAVTLVEREPAIGGKVVLFDELYPDLDCAPCLLEPVMDKVLHHPRIELLLKAELVELLGYLGNYHATIEVRPRHVDPSGCYGCQTCASVCPVEVPNAIDSGHSTHKAIYVPFPGALPNASVIDEAACLHFNGGECEACVTACAFGAIDLGGEPESLERTFGGVVVATGSELLTEGPLWESPAVLTTYEFERMLNPDGPTAGKIVTSGGKPPRTIALVHCATAGASAPAETCSRTCCLALAKFGYEIGHRVPGCRIVEFSWDRVLGGDHYRSLALSNDRPANLAEIRLDAGDSVSVEPTGTGARVSYSSGWMNETVDADLVVMAPPQNGDRSIASLSTVLGVELDPLGFVLPANHRLKSFASRIDGIFVAGCAQGPKNISQAASQGAAAAGALLSALVEGKTLIREAATAEVDPDLCGGCGLCVLACPYKAITFNRETHRSEVNALMCQGCGTCAAMCPSAAITAKHFTDGQLQAEIRVLSRTEPRVG